jgi:hypothetical protein
MSARIASGGTLRSRPRTYGTTQNAQKRSHPRIAVTYARTPPFCAGAISA